MTVDGRAAPPEPPRTARSTGAMAACQHWGATDAAVEVLEDGGNAVDAAVAAAFALGVCEPAASGLGGQTMLVLHEAATGRDVAFDGSSRAPHRIVPGELPEERRFRGHRATTVPSTPAVLGYVLEHHGRLPLARVLEPAIRLAEDGFPVSRLQHRLAERELEHLRAGSAGLHLLEDRRHPLPPGATLRQPVLAGTLRRLAEAGIEDLYRGEIAAAIVRDMEEHDGLLHADDLAQIPWPIERVPMETRFRGRRALTTGPPAAGRALVLLLNVLDRLPHLDLDDPDGALAFAELDRRVQQERKDRPFDPHLFPQLAAKRLEDPSHADEVAAAVRARVEEGHGETTHLSVVDGEGTAVALTQSIERVFGSFEAAPDLGFLYNNYLSAYDHVDVAHPHYLRPGASPWASVAPTVLLEDGEPVLAIGSPGSERIVSAIGQVLLRLEDRDPLAAVDAPRLHGSLAGVVSLEAPRMDPAIPERLRRAGLRVVEREAYAFYLGCVQLVLRDGDALVGVADPRRDGSAGGTA